MSEQIITKTCRVCKQTKSLSEFYKHQTSKDGHFNICKSCKLKKVKEYGQTKRGKEVNRKAMKQYHIRHPEQRKARTAVTHAIRDGKLPRANILGCSYCTKQAEQYHHHKGYTKKYRLDVIPICRKCHCLYSHSNSVIKLVSNFANPIFS